MNAHTASYFSPAVTPPDGQGMPKSSNACRTGL